MRCWDAVPRWRLCMRLAGLRHAASPGRGSAQRSKSTHRRWFETSHTAPLLSCSRCPPRVGPRSRLSRRDAWRLQRLRHQGRLVGCHPRSMGGEAQPRRCSACSSCSPCLAWQPMPPGPRAISSPLRAQARCVLPCRVHAELVGKGQAGSGAPVRGCLDHQHTHTQPTLASLQAPTLATAPASSSSCAASRPGSTVTRVASSPVARLAVVTAAGVTRLGGGASRDPRAGWLPLLAASILLLPSAAATPSSFQLSGLSSCGVSCGINAVFQPTQHWVEQAARAAGEPAAFAAAAVQARPTARPPLPTVVVAAALPTATTGPATAAPARLAL